jgi:CheY-like chemotaxis protein
VNDHRFVLVDDVPVNNLLTKLIIKKTINTAEIVEFTDVDSAIAFLSGASLSKPFSGKTIILLDLYMPYKDGWDFVAWFESANLEQKDEIRIWLLSSSISKADRLRAEESRTIESFILKPFTMERMADFMSEL